MCRIYLLLYPFIKNSKSKLSLVNDSFENKVIRPKTCYSNEADSTLTFHATIHATNLYYDKLCNSNLFSTSGK